MKSNRSLPSKYLNIRAYVSQISIPTRNEWDPLLFKRIEHLSIGSIEIGQRISLHGGFKVGYKNKSTQHDSEYYLEINIPYNIYIPNEDVKGGLINSNKDSIIHGEPPTQLAQRNLSEYRVLLENIKNSLRDIYEWKNDDAE